MSIVIASLISLQTLQSALASFGYLAVTLFVMIECIGIPFPGETMLLLASFYAAVDTRLQLPLVIACAALGAILGDNIGYSIGRTGGRAFIQRFGRFFFVKPQHLDYAEQFFMRHGNKTVFLGRFTTLLRLWTAFFAGVNRMRWHIFLFYNAAGGIVWAIFYGLLGYSAGRLFHNNFGQVERLANLIGWIAGATIVTIVFIIVIVVRHRLAKHRQLEEKRGC
ncbi:MAG: hypothetical protein NVS4B7_14670 [Ktedonobacteraceae bacterium]